MSLFAKFSQKPAAPAETADRVPPGQHLTKGFPVLTYGATPTVEPAQWTLRVFGAVAREHTFSWEDLHAMPQTEVVCDIHCVTTWSKLDTKWKGVRFRDLYDVIQRQCGPIAPEAKWVMQHSTGGYTTNTSLGEMLEANVLVAHTYDDKPLEREHGGPVRFMLPKLYFWKSAKWLSGLEFLTADQPGFWERYGYHMHGDPFKEERFSS